MKKDEQQRESQYVRSLIKASLDPPVTTSADGQVTDVNEAAVKVTGVFRRLTGKNASVPP